MSSVGNGFDVAPEALRVQAAEVDGLAAAVARGARAAEAVTIGHAAYGLLGQMTPLLLYPVQRYIVDALTGAAENLGDSAAKLRVVAAAYKEQDEAVAAPFRRGEVS